MKNNQNRISTREVWKKLDPFGEEVLQKQIGNLFVIISSDQHEEFFVLCVLSLKYQVFHGALGILLPSLLQPCLSLQCLGYCSIPLPASGFRGSCPAYPQLPHWYDGRINLHQTFLPFENISVCTLTNEIQFLSLIYKVSASLSPTLFLWWEDLLYPH